MIPTIVRLGNSGLKVSKIILGTMQYGNPKWQSWVLGEEDAIKHVKAAYVNIQKFTNLVASAVWLLVMMPGYKHLILVIIYFFELFTSECRIDVHKANIYSNGER